jgi:TRAP-type mannitol/chloroaromatic compound transport system permease large subunit
MHFSLFGWLDRFAFWQSMSYKTKGAIIRAVKAGLSAAVAVLLAAQLAGTLLPEGTGVYTAIVITMVLQGIDKFIRELNIERADSETETDVTGDDFDGEGKSETAATEGTSSPNP